MSNIINEPNFIIKPNPTQETYDLISSAIKDNEGYCCCAVSKNADTKCICKEFRESNECGFCHCGRYFKVKDYPIIAIVSTPEDSERAINVAEGLTTQGFIVFVPFNSDSAYYAMHQELYANIQKAKIYKADLIFVMNTSEEAMKILEEEIYWAEELGKKIIYQFMEKDEDEDRKSESI